jgi:hypothetical protein
MYEAYFGPIPEGLESHHLCFAKHCYNPGHVMLVSSREHIELTPGNIIMQQRVKTQCVRGHPFNEANTYMAPSGRRVAGAVTGREKSVGD